MTTSKTTYKSAVDYAIDNLKDIAPDDILVKLQNLSVQLEKKAASNSDRKPTKEQEQNMAYAHVVADYVRDNGAKTCAELRAEIPEFAGFTPQKMTGICNIGEKMGLVSKQTDKRKTYWMVVGE